jgi:hypothetical protein
MNNIQAKSQQYKLKKKKRKRKKPKMDRRKRAVLLIKKSAQSTLRYALLLLHKPISLTRWKKTFVTST